jgi:hypothetical protein
MLAFPEHDEHRDHEDEEDGRDQVIHWGILRDWDIPDPVSVLPGDYDTDPDRFLSSEKHPHDDVHPYVARRFAAAGARTGYAGVQSALAPLRTRQGLSPGTWPDSQAAKTVAAAGSTASRNSSHSRSRAARICSSLTSARMTGLA